MEESITYVALDAHKKQHQVAMLLPGQASLEEWCVSNGSREIGRMMKRIKKRALGAIEVCYKARPCGFALQRQIQGEGVRCPVIAPSHRNPFTLRLFCPKATQVRPSPLNGPIDWRPILKSSGLASHMRSNR